jgi:hypothetical protein
MAILNNSNAISSGGYDINNSLRFRSSASANLQRTPSTTTNRKTWTWSGWVKRGQISANSRNLFVATDNTTASTIFGFGAYSTAPDDTLYFYTDASAKLLYTTALFRDPSAWYHVVVAVDTTQATEANRVKLYVNGTQQTVTGTYPAQNADLQVNSTTYRHNIGSYYGTSAFYDGYMTEINFVDGTALTPSSFGETDTTTGSWKPKAYTSTYGTNGFYLKFSDIATTSGSNAGLGKDFSGNANYWTTNNISVTAGTTYDAMIDSPTLTSATVANYPVANPLQQGSYVTLSNGNLTVTGNTATNSAIATASFSFASGKYYYEYTQGTVATETCGFALAPVTGSLLDGEVFAANNAFGARAAGTTYGTSKIASSLTSWASGDIVGIAIDADNGAAYWSKNGVWQTSGVPTSGASKTGAVAGWTPTASSIVTPFFGAYNGGFINVNFGQRPFTYTPPTGFVRLNTFNLPDSTIKKGNTNFDVLTYTGNGATSRSFTGLSFQPDLIWNKDRTTAYSHRIVDSVRGVRKELYSNTTDQELDQWSTYGSVNSFDTNGYTITTGGTAGNFIANLNGDAQVAWIWKASGSTSSNTSGSITSTVSVNATAGFSIVLYTGNGGAMTMGHGLGVAPKLIILKDRDIGRPWPVYHGSLATNQYLILNTTAAAATSTSYWNNTAPTSTVFSVNGLEGNVGANGEKYVAYCWAEIAGFSKAFSYTGNGNADGPFVYLGFRPKFIMIKSSAGVADDWSITDTSRSTYNLCAASLRPNTSGAEDTNVGVGRVNLDILSNGFKLRQSSDIANGNGFTYIGMAWAENPFKNANAR